MDIIIRLQHEDQQKRKIYTPDPNDPFVAQMSLKQCQKLRVKDAVDVWYVYSL